MEAVLDNPVVLSTRRKSPTCRTAIDSRKSGYATVNCSSFRKTSKLRSARVGCQSYLRGIPERGRCESPGFSDRRKAMMEDLAVLTGGQRRFGHQARKTTSTSCAERSSIPKTRRRSSKALEPKKLSRPRFADSATRSKTRI